eukprot:GFYU01001607.1.p1 GENE.GFYU01001607.1~~GFYU01001607.1.p1  ORF type:complete len:233 (-),score=97.40 GFYU01001607.1:125-823(-)
MSVISRRVGSLTKGFVDPLFANKASLATAASQGLKLPDLPYDYAELEPFISAEIMELHHSKHHNTYVTNANVALEKFADAQAKGDAQTCTALLSAINFNGGGHVNHSIFWTNLAPKSAGGGDPPTGTIADMINKQWGSLDQFKTVFSTTTAAVQGSGWGWLGYDQANNRLAIQTCANQDTLATKGLVPLLGIDVWEHAYYLQYKNVRPDYLKQIWEVVNWKNVGDRLADAQK